MKSLGIFLTFFATLLIIISISVGIIGSYQYENQIKSYWDLADKASTVEKKSVNIDKFVETLENSTLKGKYNAIFLTTPNNSFDQNLEALKTLQQRLHEIQKMEVTSFEYQTAMQQITGQEQGEANEMLSVFKGVWWKENHFLLWNWIAWVQILICLGIGITGIVIWGNQEDWWY